MLETPAIFQFKAQVENGHFILFLFGSKFNNHTCIIIEILTKELFKFKEKSFASKSDDSYEKSDYFVHNQDICSKNDIILILKHKKTERILHYLVDCLLSTFSL